MVGRWTSIIYVCLMECNTSIMVKLEPCHPAILDLQGFHHSHIPCIHCGQNVYKSFTNNELHHCATYRKPCQPSTMILCEYWHISAIKCTNKATRIIIHSNKYRSILYRCNESLFDNVNFAAVIQMGK